MWYYTGSPIHDLDNIAAEIPEETVFEHLVNQDDDEAETKEEEIDEEINEQDVPQWTNHVHEHDDVNGYTKDKAQNYVEKVKNWDIEQEQSTQDSEQGKDEPTVEVKTTWHEVAQEWAETDNDYERPAAHTTHPQKQFLNVRPASPDSETTGEFFTPLATPLHSETGTPALSEHGQSEEMTSGSEMYEDAGEATPIEGDRTPVAELLEQDGKKVFFDENFFQWCSIYA